MMTNKAFAQQFKLLADLMELHGENQFRYRTYQNAYRVARSVDYHIAEADAALLSETKGFGKSILEKIEEIKASGTISKIEAYKEKTPDGILELLGVKGVGVKKIKTLWEEMEITSPGELLYACKENRLVELKGFGEKSQKNIEDQLEYYLAHQGSMLFAHAEQVYLDLAANIKKNESIEEVQPLRDLARQLPIVSELELGVVTSNPESLHAVLSELGYEAGNDAYYHHQDGGQLTVMTFTSEEELKSYHESILLKDTGLSEQPAIEVPYSMWEDATIGYLSSQSGALGSVIQVEDIKGCIHNHTTASDGSHSLEEMVAQAESNGYEYLVISDHSKSAFYANGLSAERLLAQRDSIEDINTSSKTRVYASVESDILNDGSLDYEDEVLDQLDLVIASVHSNLRMDKDKATARVIKAVEHPATRILGHPTGRLLLSRQGYPLDFEKVIDACRANHVVIELNANPHRLDIDWTWLHYIRQQGVMISINPDAHDKESYTYMRYGVLAAQKSAFPRELVLNAKPLKEFHEWIESK